MLKINAQFDTRNLIGRMKTTERNLVYSTVQSLNDTAKKIQADQRALLDSQMTIRKRTFIMRTIKIFEFASVKKGKLYAVVGIDGSKARLLMPMMETGGNKQPVKGKNVAVPITGSPARPGFDMPVADQFTFGKLKFRKRTTHTGKTQWVGEQHTFIIPGVGVFQRVPSKTRREKSKAFTNRRGQTMRYDRTTSVLLYHFEKSAPIKKRMDFRVLARNNFATYFRTALANRSRGTL